MDKDAKEEEEIINESATVSHEPGMKRIGKEMEMPRLALEFEHTFRRD